MDKLLIIMALTSLGRFLTEIFYEIRRVLFGCRPRRVYAAAKHLSFLYFSRQFAENRFQLKSIVFCDIAFIVFSILSHFFMFVKLREEVL